MMNDCGLAARLAMNKAAYWSLRLFTCARLGYDEYLEGNVWKMRRCGDKVDGDDDARRGTAFPEVQGTRCPWTPLAARHITQSLLRVQRTFAGVF